MPLRFVPLVLQVKDEDSLVVQWEGQSVLIHKVPMDITEGMTLKLKDVVAHPPRYSVAGRTVMWSPPISAYCPVSIWDGDSKVWEWTAFGGER